MPPVRLSQDHLAALRYVAVGTTAAVAYIGLTLLFSGPVGLPMWIAIALGYTLAVVLHFLLQRHFVFSHVGEFALPLRVQVPRYAAVGAMQYAITTTATATLPDVLGVSEQAFYVAITLLLAGVGFLLLRGHVFHAHGRTAERASG